VNPKQVSGGTPCRSFRDQVFHFQADELSSEERVLLEEHLHACPPCARYLEVEESFAALLRRRLAPAPAPAALRDRVREALARESEQARPRRARRKAMRWALAFAAASVAFAAVAYSILERLQAPVPETGARHVVRVATVVDEECDRAGHTAEEQRRCGKGSHLNALKLADGSYWSLSLDDPRGRELVADAALRGRRILVEGDYYGPIRTLHVTRWNAMSRGAI
jgi:mycothiol system anti-sigma-R factor